MTTPKPVRPPQVTVAGWLVIAGSAVVVLLVLDQIAKLHSLDTRDAVEDYLSRPPGDQLGLSTQEALTALRVVLTVTGVAAAAAAVLGWYALQRSTGARLALSVLAVPLFLSGFSFGGFVGGGVLPAMVTAAIVMLWLQPARDWFRGISWVAPRPTPPVSRPPSRDPLLDLPPPSTPPLYPAPYAGPSAGPSAAAAPERPASVRWACVIVWVVTAATGLLFAASLVQLLVFPDDVLGEMRRDYPSLTASDADLTRLSAVVCAVAIVWSLAGAALAVLVWRRVAWAAAALTVSAVLACLALVPVPASVATVVLLQRSEARAWLRAPVRR